MQAAEPRMRVNMVEHGQLIELYHPDGRRLFTTEGSRLVQVAGEAQRLLGVTESTPDPVWWVESRAPGNDPEAEAVARRFAHALVAAAGGVVWSSR
jgi:hypothetical protein